MSWNGAVISIFWGIIVLPWAGCAHSPHSPAPAERPKLVLQITVDQLRGDFPLRFRDRFGEGGFRYLLERGTFFTNAHYTHAITETAPGHATLYTGADASRHGIIGNNWLDRETGKPTYNSEDSRYQILGEESGKGVGTSPKNLLSSTIGDELVLATAGRSRVFAVSGKDRGAILPAGRLGKAFWYSKRSGHFVSSSYYFKELPAWVKSWNSERWADRYRTKSWSLLQARSGYVFQDRDDQPYEHGSDSKERVFPHALESEDPKQFYARIAGSPMGDELAVEFTKRLLEEEKLGQRGVTDFLSVSLSATDLIGHAYGPSSLEAEDNILRLDRALAKLFAAVDRSVGLDRTLIILSADHGSAEPTGELERLAFPAGRVGMAELRKTVNETLQKRFGVQNLVLGYVAPYLWLDVDAIRNKKLELARVEREAAAEAQKVAGVALALAKSDVLEGKIPQTGVYASIQHAVHPKRSGNIYLVPEQFWFFSEERYPELYASTHGSPWAFDTYVPIVFAGPGIDTQVVSHRVGPRDIAPSIAAYLGVRPPTGSSGAVLEEIHPRGQGLLLDLHTIH